MSLIFLVLRITKNPNYFFKLKRFLYGLKQSLKAWYERLSGFLIKQGLNSGKVNLIC